MEIIVTLELFSSTLLSLYENAITVSIVVPVVPIAFSNTNELYTVLTILIFLFSKVIFSYNY